VVAQVKGKIPVIVGTGTNSTVQTIELTRQAMKLGADAALLVTPYYNKPTQAGLFQHYQAVATAVAMPQILYNVPPRTSCDLLPVTVARLATIPNIVAFKEASGDVSRVKQLLDLGVEIDLLTGCDPNTLEFMTAGGKGVISVTANIAPKLVYDLCAAVLQGDLKAAQKYNQQLSLLNESLFVESNPIPVKWAAAKMGLVASGIRLPLTTMSEQFFDQVSGAMKMASLIS